MRTYAAAILLAVSLTASAQTRDYDAEMHAKIQEAKQLAGFDHPGLLVSLCVESPRNRVNTRDTPARYITDPSAAPPRESWFAEPAKVFDNLYFVGGSIHNSWALTTSEGIILIDTVYPYNSEELIVEGLRKVGLDPKDIKYVVISHAHGDHIGGAEILQAKYNAQVVMGGPDWDTVQSYPNRFKSMAPKKNITATDGMKLTLGDTTLNIWLTPGHTPGTLSYTFTAYDRGQPVHVVYSGGTSYNFPTVPAEIGIPQLDVYMASQKHIAEQAAATNATVLLSNHSSYDHANYFNRMFAGRGDGPHPYELGTDVVQRYFQVMQSCAAAQKILLEKEVAEGK
ncbi:MAG: MBL fold metallo-hydrolase [Acidobacteria bacterium]|nr:MBL fold metallo-hydrolase [Acidobacteriota bacterium]